MKNYYLQVYQTKKENIYINDRYTYIPINIYSHFLTVKM